MLPLLYPTPAFSPPYIVQLTGNLHSSLEVPLPSNIIYVNDELSNCHRLGMQLDKQLHKAVK